jgi:hypothetical protein
MHACAKAERRCAGDAAVPGQRASTVIELYGRVRAALAASSGVHAAPDVIKLLMVGADVTMTASALLYHGPEHLRSVKRDSVDLDGGAWLRVGAQAGGCMSHQAVTFPSVLSAHTTSGA